MGNISDTYFERRNAWELTQDEFIGPAIIKGQFAIDGRLEPEYEWIWSAAEDEMNLGFPVHITDDGYMIREIIDYEPEGTFVLVDQYGEACGFYMEGQCWIDPEHRGQGLSIHLILAASEFNGGSPTKNVDGLGFSEAGFNAHAAAHEYAVRQAYLDGKPVPDLVLQEYRIIRTPAYK